MAKIIRGMAPRRPPSFRGHGTVQAHRGGVHMQGWPKKRPGKLSDRQQAAVEKFQEAALAAQYCAWQYQVWARTWTEGSQMLPRDLLYQMFYGRLFTIGLKSGVKIYSMAARLDVSEVLDGIEQRPGGMMIRGTTMWDPIPPGVPGNVLTFTGGNPSAEWRPPSGGGGGGYFAGATTWGTSAGSGSGYATKGNILVPSQACKISEVIAYIGGPSGVGGDYKCKVLLMEGGEVGDAVLGVVAESGIIDTPSEDTIHRFIMGAPGQLEAGLTYAIVMTRVGVAGTYPARPQYFAHGDGFCITNGPFDCPLQAVQIAAADVTAGATVGASGEGHYQIWAAGLVDPEA